MIYDIIKRNFVKRIFKEFLFYFICVQSFSSKEIKIKVRICNTYVIFLYKDNIIDYDFDCSTDFVYNKICNFYKENKNKLENIFKETREELLIHNL